jgi:hypothetical protein
MECSRLLTVAIVETGRLLRTPSCTIGTTTLDQFLRSNLLQGNGHVASRRLETSICFREWMRA